jgi:nucleoside-triphosphatase THEP1
MLLGYTSDGPLYGSIDALLSTAIAGRPGQGKSTLLRGVYWQVRRIGGDVGILDPHGSILDDVQGAGARFVASTGSELDQAGALLVEELERRLEAYRRGRRDFSPLLVLADELPVLSLSSKPAVEAIGRIILEARKVGAYVLVSGQGLPADRMGGRLVRDALSSRFIFKTSADEARRCGLGGDAARLVLDLRPGVAILDGPCDPQPVAVPNCTAQDLAALVEVRARAPEPSAAPVEDTRPFGFRPELAGRSQEGTGKVQTDDSRTASGRAESLDPESTRIVSLFLGGMGIPQIVAEVYPEAGTSGRRYQDARARVEAVLRRVLGGTA